VDLLPLTPEPIRTLRPRLTREQAIEILSSGLGGVVRRMCLGPLRSVADIYVPFRLYRVAISGRRAQYLAVDAVRGDLDLYEFDSIPDSPLLADVRTRNCVPARLSIDVSRNLLHDRVRRLTYQRVGFLASGRLRVDVEPIELTVHVPYWVGFFGTGEVAAVTIIDAVRRQIEGAKARRLVREWVLD
jgi:hypothetical protein